MSINAADLFKVKIEVLKAIGCPDKLLELYCPSMQSLYDNDNPDEVLTTEQALEMVRSWENGLDALVGKNNRGELTPELLWNELMSGPVDCPYCVATGYVNRPFGSRPFNCSACTYAKQFGSCIDFDSNHYKGYKLSIDMDKDIIHISTKQLDAANVIINELRECLQREEDVSCLN